MTYALVLLASILLGRYVGRIAGRALVAVWFGACVACSGAPAPIVNEIIVTPPLSDSGVPQNDSDSPAPTLDAGATGLDSGSPAPGVDSGSPAPVTDSGIPSLDSGSPVTDAGVTNLDSASPPGDACANADRNTSSVALLCTCHDGPAPSITKAIMQSGGVSTDTYVQTPSQCLQWCDYTCGCLLGLGFFCQQGSPSCYTDSRGIPSLVCVTP